MITLDCKKKIQKTFHTIQILVVLLSLLLSLQPVEAAQAHPANSIGTMDLTLSTKDISRVEFGYHHSSFESTDTQYKLNVKGGLLTDGKVKAPLSSLNSLVSSLHGMYPGTRSLIWQSWTDDYPHAWIDLYLNDGRLIEISSDSQFTGMFPWNISVWASDKAAQPDAMYIQLQPTFLNGVDALWRGISQQGFPRGNYSGSFWKDMLGDPAPETVKFNVPTQYSPDIDGSETAPVWGTSPASLAPFLPELNQNSEIKTLLDAGYNLYDAAFTLEVKTRTLEPIQYNGTLALVAPGGEDAVVGLVTLPLGTGQPVTTTLKAADSMQLVEQRRASQFLNDAAQILTPLTFILDTRANIEAPTLDCPNNKSISLHGQATQAIWNPAQPMRITFFPLTDGRWSVNLGMQRGDPNWNDTLVQSILKDWFPETIAALPIQDLQSFDTSWQIALEPNVTLTYPKLLDDLKAGLPEGLVVHVQDPEKAGDYSFLKLDGRVVISENGTPPVIVYCGVTLPDYYGQAYPIGSVIPPNDQAARVDMPGGIGKNGEWRSLSGPLPLGQYSAQWASIAISQPGFLHVLWTVEGKGVYYADGWIDGTGWTEAQRLGDEAYWVDIRAWPDGEVHLFWDAGLNTGGTIHVWRPAGGSWQKPEHWADIGYFGEILRDPNGILHLGGIASDGLDAEFMHWTWSPEKGLSAPENISRHIGDTGSGNYILRFDSKGQLHAAWSHILQQKSAPDPITGETSDISGVFYARRLPDGHWSQPEQVGILAPYAHALSMELDAQDNPLIIWQAESGLISRIKKNGAWGDVVELANVKPPETPAEFGPGRWVQPTAELRTAVNTQGQIIAGWLIPSTCLNMASWSEAGWTDSVDIVPAEEISKLSSEAPALEMVVDNQDRVHFVFFEYEGYPQGSELYYAVYDHQKVESHPLSIYYDMYGLPEASLAVDSASSVAILGLPRSPAFVVKMPLAGIPPTPSPTPKPSPTLRPTMTHLPTLTPLGNPTPQQLAKKSGIESPVPLIIGFGILLAIIIIGIAAIRLLKKRPSSG